MAQKNNNKNKAEQMLNRNLQSSRTAGTQKRQPGRRTSASPNRSARSDPSYQTARNHRREADRRKYAQEKKKRQDREERILYNDGYAGFEQEFEPVREKRKPVSPAKRRFIRIATLCFLLFTFIVAGVILSCTVFFMAEQITVTFPKDFKRYSTQQVVDASGLEIGKNLFLSDKKGAEKKIIEAFPYVKDASVEISLPDTLEIIITQANPRCYAQLGKNYMIIGDNDRILEIKKESDKLNLPMLKGIEIQSGNVGDKAVFKNENSKQILFKLIDSAKACGLTDISEIDMTSMANITLSYEKRIKIIVGTHEDIEYKLKTAKTIITEKLSKEDTGTLDVSLCNSGKKQSSFLPAQAESTISVIEPVSTDSDTETDSEYTEDAPVDDTYYEPEESYDDTYDDTYYEPEESYDDTYDDTYYEPDDSYDDSYDDTYYEPDDGYDTWE